MKRLGSPFVLVALLAAFVLGPPAAAQAEGSSLSPQAAAKQFKQRTNSHLKFHKQELNRITKDFCAALKELQSGVLSGEVSAFDAMPLYMLLVATAQAQIIQTTDTVLGAMDADGSDIQQQVFPTSPLIPFLVGACSTLDSGTGRVLVQEEQAINKIVKKLKGFGKKMEKKTGQGATVKVVAPDAGMPPTPNPGGPAPAPPKPLKIDSLAGSSDRTVADDGKICVGGTASVGTVSVTIHGPGGEETLVAIVDGTCRWSVCFGGTGKTGDLVEGNYSVRATQGGETTRSSIGVP